MTKRVAMKPTLAWAVVMDGALVTTHGDGDARFILLPRRPGVDWLYEGERAVRVEVREVPKRTKGKP